VTWTDPSTGISTRNPDGPNWEYPGAGRRRDPDAPVPESPPRNVSTRVVVAGVILAIAGLICGFVVTASIVSDNKSSGNTNAAAPPTAPGIVPGFGNAGGNDPHASALDALVLQQSDVPSTDIVSTVQNGTDVVGSTTLDLCNGNFPSESLRTARRQVAVFDALGDAPISTEAVLYHHPSDSTQAFTELRSVAKNCPSTPVVSPVGEPTTTTKFAAAPDGAWNHTPGVDRLAYAITSTPQDTGLTTRSIVVYLRRGRALMGLYFSDPDSAQIPVQGETTVRGVVHIFEQRMAALPNDVINSP
jgi:hypothetical protein